MSRHTPSYPGMIEAQQRARQTQLLRAGIEMRAGEIAKDRLDKLRWGCGHAQGAMCRLCGERAIVERETLISALFRVLVLKEGEAPLTREELEGLLVKAIVERPTVNDLAASTPAPETDAQPAEALPPAETPSAESNVVVLSMP